MQCDRMNVGNRLKIINDNNNYCDVKQRNCPDSTALINQVKMTAEEALGTPVMVEMGAEMWDPSMMEEGAGGDWGLL